MKGYADLASLPEDDRIAVIRETVAQGISVGIFVDDDEKADRYIEKLGAAVAVLDRRKPGSVLNVRNAVFIKFGPRVH